MFKIDEIRKQTEQALEELLKAAALKRGDILVVGCSTSEILGMQIGKGSNEEVAAAVYDGMYPLLEHEGIYLAAQCCEHLNRALIIEEDALCRCDEIVNVVPQLHAGGAFAMTVYHHARRPAAVEHIRAAAGIDIGDTFIGMHLREVAVPVRLSLRAIGDAHLSAARTRPKTIGGARAVYDEALM